MIQSPCKGCTERRILCHARCSRYAEYKRRKDMAAEAERLYSMLRAANYTKIKSHDAYIADKCRGKIH